MTADRDKVARHVGRRIKALRAARGLDEGALARHLDCTIAELRRFESGEERIAPNLLVAMARLAEVDVDWFFRDAPADERPADPADEIAGRFMALPEAPPLMRAFVGIGSREARLAVVGFARMASASPG